MTDQIFSQGISKTRKSIGDGMSQQGTGQREANQTKHGEYVTSEDHPRSVVVCGVHLQADNGYSMQNCVWSGFVLTVICFCPRS